MSPRVSVVIPARNAAATLPATLASVQAQTFSDWEVVLVDDGSTDGTGDIARAAGERVRVLRNDPARGPSVARNRGVREARGELVATLDSDDTIEPRYLESQIAVYDAAVREGRRVGAVSCDAELVTSAGPAGRWSDRTRRGGRADLEVLLRENVVFGNALVDRAAFLELGGYDEDPVMTVEDYDLWVRMVERGWEIVLNPEVLATYNLGDTSRSTGVAANARASQLIFERLIERGTLTPHQRRMAARRIRAHRVVELRGTIAEEPGRARRTLLAARAAPLVIVSMLEHPDRWLHWLRGGLRPAGAGRHTWRG